MAAAINQIDAHFYSTEYIKSVVVTTIHVLYIVQCTVLYSYGEWSTTIFLRHRTLDESAKYEKDEKLRDSS